MTNAPTDLLGLRTRLQALTGLSAVDVGIVGDAAHAASGGYHIGRSGLAAAGVWSSDYSVRLTRDRNGATESASAMDVGAGWRQGRAVWLRWANLFANALRAGDPALAAVRAINYSPDGSLRWRIDREQAWRTESSSDVVDIHTHIEWYRDTEGHRQASLDRIAALAQQAITGQSASTGGFMTALSDLEQRQMFQRIEALLKGLDSRTDSGAGLVTETNGGAAAVKGIASDVSAVKTAVSAPATVTLSQADRDAIVAGLAGLVPTLEELRSLVDAAVKARLDGATLHAAGA